MNFLMGPDRGSVCVGGGFLVGGPGKTEKKVVYGLCVGGLVLWCGGFPRPLPK